MENNKDNNKNKIFEKFSKMTPSLKFNFKLDLKSLPQKIIHILREYKRVILVTKKPDLDELSKISKVAGLGILLIGVIGFILQMMSRLFLGM